MSEGLDIRKRITEAIASSEKTGISYDIDKGTLDINSQTYEIGRLSFSEVAGAVLGSLKEMYGEYATVPYSFNSEAYENENFRAEVLALGSIGLLEFSVYRKNSA
jgi:hypothetical protein